MPQINKNLYLGVIFGGPILFLVLLVVGILLMFVQNDALTLAASGLICFGYIPAIAGIVFTAMLVYKLWDSIQDGTARTTPGKGVGFLFIPFFNFYWIYLFILFIHHVVKPITINRFFDIVFVISPIRDLAGIGVRHDVRQRHDVTRPRVGTS